MRIPFFLLLAALFFTVSAQAQRGQRLERIKAYRVAIFTEVLELTETEAQGFWPLYNELQDKRKALGAEMHLNEDIDDMTDKEIEAHIQKRFENEQKELNLNKEYFEKFKKVLPLRKVAKIPMAERRFREALVKKMAERKRGKD